MQECGIQSEGCGTRTPLYSSRKRPLRNRWKCLERKGRRTQNEPSKFHFSFIKRTLSPLLGSPYFSDFNIPLLHFRDARQQLVDTELRNAKLRTENLLLEKQVWDLKLCYWREKHRLLHSSTTVWSRVVMPSSFLYSYVSTHIRFWILAHTSTCGIPVVEIVGPMHM